MLTKTTKPTSKSQLISSLHQTQVDAVEVKEVQSKKNIKNIIKDIQVFYGSGSKPVSVVFLKGRS
ncbi:hypothetical protein JCM17960_34750 [Magnetospira thiophila]